MGKNWLTSDHVHFYSDKEENAVNRFLQVKSIAAHSVVLSIPLPPEEHRGMCQVIFGLGKTASSDRGRIFYSCMLCYCAIH